ncbi:MAG: fused MFS/spermidine synthase [Anaerolineae bacterium]|nr:fused MFS/spermidine synthase [Anaerolineae bacterium]
MSTERADNGFLLLLAFLGGLVSLGVELAASRLLAPFFGESLPVWAAVIGLILLYLTVGYFLGGRWADRSPCPATFYSIALWGAWLVGLLPFVARPVLFQAVEGMVRFSIPLTVGPFVAVLLLFAAPVTLLGCLSPFAIRLLVDRVEKTGGVAGQVYALSTVGSLLGTLLTVFGLIPTLGTRLTFVALSLVLLLPALAGLARARPRRAVFYLWMPLIVLALALWARGRFIKPQAGIIYEAESAYHYIQVVERGGKRYLFLNEGLGIHSVYCPGARRVGGTWDLFLVAPFFNPPPFLPERIRSMAMVGLAGGTVPKLYTAFYGPIPIDGIELDPTVVQVGRKYFGMTEPNLRIMIGDGRAVLARSPRRYSVIGVDAYRLPYIPWHLATVEFFQEVHRHLDENGVVVVNVGRVPGDDRLVAAVAATLRAVFPTVYAIDVPHSFNTLLIATVHPTTAENLRANREEMADPDLRAVADQALANLRPVPEGGPVLTDDWAPVETITHAMILAYLRAYGIRRAE